MIWEDINLNFLYGPWDYDVWDDTDESPNNYRKRLKKEKVAPLPDRGSREPDPDPSRSLFEGWTKFTSETEEENAIDHPRELPAK